MPVIYPEGGMPGLVLKQKRAPRAIDTFKVQLVPLRAAPSAKIGGPDDVVKLMREMEDYDRESVKIIHLDTKNQVMGIETISIGSLAASIVHPRETVKGAILNNSANVIFVHNHPSGICEPSNEDIEISGRLKEAFALVGIELLDSIIVGKGCQYSFRESGFITGKTEKFTAVSERFADMPKEERMRMAHGIAAITGHPQEQWKFFTLDDLSKLPMEERKKYMKMILASQIKFSVVKESAITQETVDKIEFITALTDYINAHDLERRNRAAEKIKASRYFKPWFDEFFYEHDRERAKQKLMKFFVANEQGLELVNHANYSVLSEYLRAISKPVLMVREAAGPCERIKEIKAEQQRISKELADAYRAKDNPRVKKLVETGNSLRAEWDSLVRKCQEIQWKKMKGTEQTVSENIAGQEDKMQIWVEDAVYEYVKNNPNVNLVNIVLHFKLRNDITLKALAQLEKDHKVERKWLGFRYGYITFPEQKSSSTVSENIPKVNNTQSILTSLTVDTGTHSRTNPIPGSAVIGAAIPEDGFLFAYHITDDPVRALSKIRAGIDPCKVNTYGDLGCGFYVSGVPEYWRVRSRAKWDFAKNLNRAQRQALVNVILSDPNYRKGGGYLADFEVDYLNRDLKLFVEKGDVNVLASTGNQPYNVEITKEIARKAGVPVPEAPRMIQVKLQGKFINGEGLYSNPEIVRTARAWAMANRSRAVMNISDPHNTVNAWLHSMGYSGAFTKSGMSTNPEMVIWDRKAIVEARIPERA